MQNCTSEELTENCSQYFQMNETKSAPSIITLYKSKND